MSYHSAKGVDRFGELSSSRAARCPTGACGVTRPAPIDEPGGSGSGRVRVGSGRVGSGRVGSVLFHPPGSNLLG
jgi:hypothetical protein